MPATMSEISDNAVPAGTEPAGTDPAAPDILVPDGTNGCSALVKPAIHTSPWILNRYELRDTLDYLISSRDNDLIAPVQKTQDSEHTKPAFAFIRVIKKNVSRYSVDTDMALAEAFAKSRGSQRLELYSVALINALRSVVDYYPGQALEGETITIDWPFAILVHHYDELKAFRDRCAAKAPSERCELEINAEEHLDLLLGFLDEQIMPTAREEQTLSQKGADTFEGLWVTMRPGSAFMFWREDEGPARLYPAVVRSLSGGIFTNPPGSWLISYWTLAFDGEVFGRTSNVISLRQGVKPMKIIDERTLTTINDEDIKAQLSVGKKFWQLVKERSCNAHAGKSTRFPNIQVRLYPNVVFL
jgi:hypothetical protein